jgi:hypothetical protein
MPTIPHFLICMLPSPQFKLEPGNPSSQAPVGLQFTLVLVEILPNQSAVLFNLVHADHSTPPQNGKLTDREQPPLKPKLKPN